MTIRDVATAVALVATAVLLSACGDTAPASPSPTTETYTLSGTVRQSAPTPDVVPDARVEVIDGPDAGRAAMSDASGRYTLSGLAAGTFRVRARRDGYAPAEQAVALSRHTTVDFTIVRGSACTLSGAVRESPGNAPSMGAFVALVKEPGGSSAPAIVSTTTDATGTYRLVGIDCGVSRLLRVGKADFFTQQESVLIAGDTQRDLTIDRVTYPLRGFVRESASGAPLVDATVEVLSGPYAGRTATTHPDGSYGLSVRDTVTVRASKPGYVSQDAVVTVTFPATDRNFSLALAP